MAVGGHAVEGASDRKYKFLNASFTGSSGSF